MNRHNHQANTSDNTTIIDPALEFNHTTEPNLQKIPSTQEISDHQLHSTSHPEPVPDITHSSTVTLSTTEASPIIRHDPLTPQNQAIWDTYHAIQKQIADIQAMLQSAINLLQHDHMPHTITDATTQSDSPADQPHPNNRDLQTLADTSKVSHIPTTLLFDISNTSRLLHCDPISYSTTVHHRSNYKRSSYQLPSFDFLQIIKNMPDTYLPCTPTDILHKLWHSNLVPNTTTTIIWPSIWPKPNTHNLPIQTVLSPNCYTCETTATAITAPYSLKFDLSNFTLLLPVQAKQCYPTILLPAITSCASQIHRLPKNLMLSDLHPSTAIGIPTNLPQQDWYSVPKYPLQEHLRTDLMHFQWYYIGLHIKPPRQFTATLPTYSTDYPIRHSASLLYSMVGVAPALTDMMMKAYLPALATEFRPGPRSWITWTYGKHHTATPLPATPDKNLLRPP